MIRPWRKVPKTPWLVCRRQQPRYLQTPMMFPMWTCPARLIPASWNRPSMRPASRLARLLQRRVGLRVRILVRTTVFPEPDGVRS